MKVRRYEAKDIQEALTEVKKDLGPDAVVLVSRRIPRWEALKAAFWKPSMEVMAAVPPNGREPDKKKSSRADRQAMLERGLGAGTVELTDDPVHYRKLFSILQACSIERSLSRRILKGLLHNEEENGDGGASDWSDEKLTARLAAELMKWIPTSGPVKTDSGRPRVVAFVGPTGAGKTTSLVKLATRHALKKGAGQVVLATQDTYRVGAVEQLAAYGRLLRAPVEVIRDVRELADIVDRYGHASLICVDTAGRSPSEPSHAASLRETFRRVPSVEVHLVLSATTRDREMEATAKGFYDVPFHRVLFTKVDEGVAMGSMLNLAWKVNCPISYVAMGQKIPEDLEIATPELITDIILRPHW